MPDLRPETETFDRAGCRVTVVDAAGIVEAARDQRVELLRGAAFPAPVRRVRFSVASGERDGAAVHVMEARIQVGEPSGAPVLGTDPIGVLLARRVAAGDPVVARIVDGVDSVAARLGLARVPRPAAPSPTKELRETEGLRATVTRAAGTVAVRAEVASAEVAPAHLRAMVGLVLDLVADLAGPKALAGREYTLSRAASDGAGLVTLDQVGGLTEVVAQFRQVAVSFRHPQAMARWGARRPQGILMYGPPGTGKTMLARALATEIDARFREIRTPEILDKWLGASERNIKRIFRQARHYREPTVLLFDEFDSIISYTHGGSDAASQAVNAVAGIFKQEMNNLIEDNPNVIVVATTNFPNRVDASLIRSGRFDLKLAIPPPDEGARAEILVKMIRQLIAAHEVAGFRMFAEDVDPAGLAAATSGMTGADLKEVLRRAQLAKAMEEARSGVVAPPISQDDLLRGVADLRGDRPPIAR